MVPAFRYLPLTASLVVQAATARAQSGLDSLVLRLGAMTAVSGYEQAMSDTLQSLLPGSVRDRAGNVVLTLGSGQPRRLIACPMDEPGYVVGRVRPDGYLSLRRVGPSAGPLADQQLEGQRVTVWGRRGALPGVVGVRSIHLTRGRPPLADPPFPLDEAFVDIGAVSAAEAQALGVSVLAPVALEKRPHRYADSLIATTAAGRRGACAALLEAARRSAPGRGTWVISFIVEQNFTQRGLLSLANTQGPFTSSILLDAGGSREVIADFPSPAPGLLPAMEHWLLPARYLGSAVETISLGDVAALLAGLTLRIEGSE